MSNYLIEQMGLIGDMIPNVYIKSIAINKKGGEVVEQLNPHVDVSEYSKFSAATGETVIVSPPVNYSGKAKTSETLVINIELVMKDSTTSSGTGTWMNNEDILKYLKVRVVQSTHRSFTRAISSGVMTLDPEDYKSHPRADHALEQTYALSDYVVKTDPKRPTVLIEQSGDPHIDQPGQNRLQAYYSTTDSQNNVVYDIPIDATFTHKETGPSHLAYFAATYFDTQQMIEDYRLDLTQEMKRGVIGKIAAENVINNSQVVVNSYIYYLSDDSIWTGPVQKIETKWYTQGLATDLQLRRRQVANKTVKDLRKTAEIEDVPIDFSMVQAELLGITSTIGVVSSDPLTLNSQQTHFSDDMIARDSSGRTRFVLTVDYQNLLRDSTLYGKFFTHPRSQVTELVQQYTDLRSIRVYRKRVKTSVRKNRLGMDADFVDWFDPTQGPELIATSEEADDKFLRPKTLYKDSYGVKTTSASDQNGQNTFFGSIREVELSVDQYVSGLRHFTVIDGNMSDVTDGLYQYYVEIDIEDGTKTFLEDLLSVLTNVRIGIERYYNESLQAQNYDFQANKFKQQFIDAQSEKYLPDLVGAPWVYGPITYLDVLNTLTMDSYASMVGEYAKALHAIASPSTGTPDGINTLLGLVSSLESNIRSTIGLKKDHSNAQIGPNTPKRIVNIVHEMKHIFDSNVAKNAGIDYLSGQETNLDGLRVVTGTEWESRTTSETQKFYTAPTDITLKIAGEEDSSTTLSTNHVEMTYLSPASIDLYSTSYNLLDGAANFDPSYCDEIVYTALNYSPSTPPPYSPDTTTGIDDIELSTITATSLLSTANNSGLTIMSIEDFKSFAPVSDGLNKAQEYVGENSKFLSEDLDQEIFPEPEPIKLTSTSFNLLTALCSPCIFTNAAAPDVPGSAFNTTIVTSPTLSNFNLSSTSNPIITKLSSLTTKGYQKTTAMSMITNELSEIPNQLKSLMLTSGTPLPEASESTEAQASSTILTSEISAAPVITSTNSSAAASSVRANWYATGVDSFTTETTISTMVVNYQMLSQIEVLSGYEGMVIGSPSVRAPMWTPMTGELYAANFNKLLLCRITRYSSSTFGVSTPSGVELPIYNEYFFLKPFDVSVVDEVSETTRYRTSTVKELKNTTLPSLTVEVEGLLTTLGYSLSQGDVATIATEYMSTINVPYNANYLTQTNNSGY